MAEPKERQRAGSPSSGEISEYPPPYSSGFISSILDETANQFLHHDRATSHLMEVCSSLLLVFGILAGNFRLNLLNY